ncbi:MAG: hypothetical protein MZW92_79965 [Comamonadaceae bacterium]|nr:hypothetical protein [Comamonadaceae bacterium]
MDILKKLGVEEGCRSDPAVLLLFPVALWPDGPTGPPLARLLHHSTCSVIRTLRNAARSGHRRARSRAAGICAGLALAFGYQVAAVLSASLDLAAQVEAIRPDVILIETASLSRDTLEHLGAMNRDAPRPVVIFAQEGDAGVIRAAMRAGVAAYVGGRPRPRPHQAGDRGGDCRASMQDQALAPRTARRHRASCPSASPIDRAKGLLMQRPQPSPRTRPTTPCASRRWSAARPWPTCSRDVIDMAQLLL